MPAAAMGYDERCQLVAESIWAVSLYIRLGALAAPNAACFGEIPQDAHTVLSVA